MRPAPIFRSILAAAAVAAIVLRSHGEAPAPAAPAPPAWTPQQKASLEILDQAIARFDRLLARDDDARHQAATRATLEALKQRRDALRLAFDQSKYDDLRTELSLESHRLAAWVGPAPAAH
jgi:hypothetical protein